MVSFEEFANELRSFNARSEIVNEIRREMRKPLPELRSEVRSSAASTLPSSGGLAAWVAKATMTVRFKDTGRAAGLRLKLSRKAGDGDKADLDALDRTGKLRHPVFKRARARERWVGQQVTPGFFTKVWERYRPKWVEAADAALDRALDKIRNG